MVEELARNALSPSLRDHGKLVLPRQLPLMHARLKLRPGSSWAIFEVVLLSAVQHVTSTGAQVRSGAALSSKAQGLLLELQPDPLWHAPPPMSGPLPYQGEWTYAPPWKEWNGGASNSNDNEPPEPEVYRPWALRFKHLPGDPYTDKQENREGYRRFREMNPHHPNGPGSADRNAESATMLVCALAAFGTVIGAGITWERYSGAAHPEKMALMLGVSFSLPWLLAMVYLVHVAMDHFAHPARGPTGQHWECDAATWYLLVAPILTTLTIISQVVWLFGAPGDYSAAEAPMGRMMTGGPNTASRSRFLKASDGTEETGIERFLRNLGKPVYAMTFLVLEVIATALAIALSILDEYLCEPEVWWAVTYIASATLLVLIVAPVSIFFFWRVVPPIRKEVEESLKPVDGAVRRDSASGMRGPNNDMGNVPLDVGPGVYVVTHGMVAVTAEPSQSSAIVTPLLAGHRIKILEVLRLEEEQKIRGRIENPAGWISLVDLANGRSWARREQ